MSLGIGNSTSQKIGTRRLLSEKAYQSLLPKSVYKKLDWVFVPAVQVLPQWQHTNIQNYLAAVYLRAPVIIELEPVQVKTVSYKGSTWAYRQRGQHTRYINTGKIPGLLRPEVEDIISISKEDNIEANWSSILIEEESYGLDQIDILDVR